MDDAAVRAQIAVAYPKDKALDDAMTTLYATIQQVDKRDPRFTATMRQYGILPQLSTFLGLQGDMMTQLKPLLDELDPRVQPKT